jgi:hypothetical protein
MNCPLPDVTSTLTTGSLSNLMSLQPNGAVLSCSTSTVCVVVCQRVVSDYTEVINLGHYVHSRCVRLCYVGGVTGRHDGYVLSEQRCAHTGMHAAALYTAFTCAQPRLTGSGSGNPLTRYSYDVVSGEHTSTLRVIKACTQALAPRLYSPQTTFL